MFSIASLVSRYRLIAHHQVVALLALQYLAYGVAAHRRLDRVLHVRHVDPVARRLLAIHREIQVGLADHAKHSQVLHACNAAHHVDDLVALLLPEA